MAGDALQEFDAFIQESRKRKCSVCDNPEIENINRLYRERYIPGLCSIADIGKFYEVADSTMRGHFQRGHADE